MENRVAHKKNVYMRHVDRVIAKVCRNDGEKQLFKKVCKWIRECPSREAVSPPPHFMNL